MTGLLTRQAAVALMLETTPQLTTETLSLSQCLGRILAEKVKAPRDQPPAALSVMDGYALAEQRDLLQGSEFKVIGTSQPGAPFADNLTKGDAVRILTGAAVPKGAIRVVVQEDTKREGEHIILTAHIDATSPSFVRPAGADFAEGETVLAKGTRLASAHLALAAAANRAELNVIRKPKVAIVASGDELVEPGGTLSPDIIVNSAAYGVAALAEAFGAEVTCSGVLADDKLRALEQIEEMGVLDHRAVDLLVLIGGASVGDRDVARPVIEALAGRIVFAGVAMKPGKPVWSASLPKGPQVLGLPGNPASALVCAQLFLGAWINRCMLQPAGSDAVTARTAVALRANGPREAFLRATHTVDDEGRLIVEPSQRQDSGLLTPFAGATCLLRRPAHAPALKAGQACEIVPLVGYAGRVGRMPSHT